jgi:hypothetical protein
VAIIRGIFITYQFPIIANIGKFLNEYVGLKEHGGVRGGKGGSALPPAWGGKGGSALPPPYIEFLGTGCFT